MNNLSKIIKAIKHIPKNKNFTVGSFVQFKSPIKSPEGLVAPSSFLTDFDEKNIPQDLIKHGNLIMKENKAEITHIIKTPNKTIYILHFATIKQSQNTGLYSTQIGYRKKDLQAYTETKNE